MATRFCLTAASSLDKYPAKQHAQAVARQLGVKKGLICLPGQPTVWQEDSDEPYPFRQRRYFYYLSGVDERDCFLTYDVGKDHLVLYIPVADRRTIVYNGPGLTVAEAYDRYDVDSVKHSAKVSEDVTTWMKRYSKDNVFLLHPTQEAFPGQNKLPRVDYTKLMMAMDRCRVIKDPHEISLIRKANDISAKAHRAVLSKIASLDNEAQVEAIFKDICISDLAKHQAYPPIAASGQNAATLHYMRNDEPLAGRQLMCLDAGCEWQLYASDVTRTFPLGKSWPSTEAKAIYDLVQDMQASCIEKVKPGVRFLDLHHLAHKIAVKGLLQLGILHNGDEKEIIEAGTSLAFFPHGLGHHMGLEVHDVSDLPINSLANDSASSGGSPFDVLLVDGMCHAPVDRRSKGLEEGMVVTIEPGIYFSKYAIEEIYLKSPIHSKYIKKEALGAYYPVGGVRIEDDILVTHNGYENLTTAPKGEEMLELIRSGSSVSFRRSENNATALPASIAKSPQLLRASSTTSGRSTEISTQPRKTSQKAPKVESSTRPQALEHPEQRRSDCFPLPHAKSSSLLDGFQQACAFRSRPSSATLEKSCGPRHTLIEDRDQGVKHSTADIGRDSPRLETSFPLTHEQLAESVRRLQSRPYIPGKTPRLPQKPLAYRQSLPAISDMATLNDGYSGRLPKNKRRMERFTEDLINQDDSYEQGIGQDTSTRAAGLHRVQSQLLPQVALPHPPNTCNSALRRAQTQLHTQTRPYFRPQTQIQPLNTHAYHGRMNQSDFVLRVAAVTTTYIHSIHENRGKNVNGDEIRRMLEKNPRLDELCRMLRVMDLKLDNIALADALITAVPGINLNSLATTMKGGFQRLG